MPANFTNYVIRIRAEGGQGVSILTLICANDRDIMTAAQVLPHPYGLDIWDGERLVASFPATGARAAA